LNDFRREDRGTLDDVDVKESTERADEDARESEDMTELTEENAIEF
jgi:hypothetical protein